MKKIGIISALALALWSGAGRISAQDTKPVFSGREIKPEGAAASPYYFSRPVAVNYDSANIFILDARDNEVKVFSKDGRHRFSFGSKGQGPGEFNGPCDMDILGDKIYIADGSNRRIQIVNKKGEYLSGFNTGFFPWRILALDGERVVVVPLPAGRSGGGRALHCFNLRGEPLWTAIDSLSSGDPALEAMENQIFIRKGRGGEFYALRPVNDSLIRRLDASGAVVAEAEIAADYPFKEIAVPGARGQKKTLRGLCWNCAADGETLYLIVPEFTEDKDLGPGRRVAVVSPSGRVEAFIDLPDRVSRIAVEGVRIYGLDLDFRLRLFELEKK
jgi:outer membrane protein assembly factor BamB